MYISLANKLLTTNFELILIILLLIYILFLQLRLAKKNHILESYLNDLQKKEDNYSAIQSQINTESLGSKGIKDKFLNDDIYNFLFGHNDDVKIYLHYTREKKVANDILTEGFKFVNSFYKTAELVFNDKLYLMHRHNEHKQFGEYVIVICILKTNFNHYTQELSKLQAKNIAVEQIMTEISHQTDENGEEVYTSPKQFIKGYFNYLNGSIVTNPYYNPEYLSPVFDENINKLKKLSH